MKWGLRSLLDQPPAQGHVLFHPQSLMQHLEDNYDGIHIKVPAKVEKHLGFWRLSIALI